MKKNHNSDAVKAIKKEPYSEIFRQNENRANLFISNALLIVGIVMASILLVVAILCTKEKVLTSIVFVNYGILINTLSIVAIILLFLPRVLCMCVHKHVRIIKYVCFLVLMFMALVFAEIDERVAVLILAVPIIFSTVYADKKVTLKVFIMSAIDGILAFLPNAIYAIAKSDTSTYLTDSLSPFYRDIMAYLLNLLVYLFISVLCVHIAGQVRTMVIEQNNAYLANMKNEKINADIRFAYTIQHSILPVPDNSFFRDYRFSIDASMDPANGVGGDFYDFFMIDDRHIVFLIADVSGKGLPAAMFMMSAKGVIKDVAYLKNNTGEILTTVNRRLCSNNESHLFITAWLGILDIETGHLTYSNAGHNPPLICRNGKFEYFYSKPGLVLALMDNMKYTQNETTLNPGDMIFLYTDGITEAINSQKEEYGEERLKLYLNSCKNNNLSDVISGVKADVDTFSGDEEQFDDMTMLLLKFNGGNTEKMAQEHNFFPAKLDSLEKVREVVLQKVSENNISEEICELVLLALEEIFVNIVSYAYQDEEKECFFWFDCTVENDMIILSFKDKGIPYNPLNKDDPDITAKAENRKIGGLGIFMTKEIMDDFSYEYKDNMNCLTLVKKIK